MSERSREKAALAVFALLVTFAGCCLVGYLVAGHSWNVAATNIDDTFGSLDGYTVIAYAGTVEEKKSPSAGASAGKDAAGADSAEADAPDSSEAAGIGFGAGSKAEGDGAVFDAGEASVDSGFDGSGGSGAGADGARDGLSVGAGADGAEADANATSDADSSTGAGATSDVDPSTGAGAIAGPLSSPQGSERTSSSVGKTAVTSVSVEDVRQSYEDKGATVFILDTEHMGRYSEGTILKKGDHRFGVFSIEKPMTLLTLKRMINYFKQHEVDFIVAVVADDELLKDSEDIDIVISTKDENLFAMGKMQNGTFYVNAPAVGEVGAVLISPSNVVSAKTVDSL